MTRKILAGPSQTKTLVNPTGKDPVDAKATGKAVAVIKNAASTTTVDDKKAGKAHLSPTKIRQLAEQQRPEAPIFRGPKKNYVDPSDPTGNNIQQRIVDRPMMFRKTGLHPRTTTPGRVANRFARANTNVPLWSGDIATTAAPKPAGNPAESQRQAARQRLTQKYNHKEVGNFFVATKENKAPVEGTKEIENCLSGSRRGGAPPELKQNTVANLKVGVAVPDEHVSIHRNYGKKQTHEHSPSHHQSTNEVTYHGKKNFPERQNTFSTKATEIGSPKRTQQVASSEALQNTKRFENSRRFNANITHDHHISKDANSQEFDYDARKKHTNCPPGNKSGQTLQYVFEAPVKRVNTAYRPVAPWE
jgi:hypothetical protein